MSNTFFVIYVKKESDNHFIRKIKKCYSLDDVKHYVKMKDLLPGEYSIIEGGEVLKP